MLKDQSHFTVKTLKFDWPPTLMNCALKELRDWFESKSITTLSYKSYDHKSHAQCGVESILLSECSLMQLMLKCKKLICKINWVWNNRKKFLILLMNGQNSHRSNAKIVFEIPLTN